MTRGKLAQKVKELRKGKALSQEELAKKSGLSLRTIQRLENGETEPTGETLKRISSELNITLNELIGKVGDEPKKTVKTKYEYLHIFDKKLVISKTSEINDLVEDYGKSVDNVFKTLMVFFAFIPVFITLSVIFYNMGKTGLAIYTGAFAFTFLVIAFNTILFTSGSSIIKMENVTRIRIQNKLFNNVVLISHRESGRMKVRALVLEKNQVEIMKNTLVSEKLIVERDIKLKGNKNQIYIFFILVFLMSASGQFSKLFFKEIDPMMINGFILLFVSVLFLINMIFKLINPLFKKQQTASVLYK
ncbi:helix-turn-helix domain-containing protein [Algibacter sp. L4_22]|uniref:helix-turn-helix domain-containing protein n=1 Tax=Algibacter sp. L4_22 TaxID=2942477 RepID=UPI00201B4990|nr:helix-turn-helix transcriptional regulator [Algibacter sp. L4_22]MCL5128919.1 helix-turn-helix domain-containing protein [Algibacter sp. L4_22]